MMGTRARQTYITHGLVDVSDDVFRGKGVSALLASRDGKDRIVREFGGRENVPSSVMRAKKEPRDESTDEAIAGRRYDESNSERDGDELRSFNLSGRGTKASGKSRRYGQQVKGSMAKVAGDKELEAAFSATNRDVRAGALSAFPWNVGRSLLLLYSEPGALVFDPFAGHNSRMELCVSGGRHYIGCDISAEFMRFNRRRAAELAKIFPSAKIKLHERDSRHLNVVASASADFTITSPPYYDIEWYGDEKAQLGKAQSYEQFLSGLGEVLVENFRILRSGAICVWFVNDFRRKGKFHLYHVDTIRLAEAAGFRPRDLVVVDFGPGIRDAFTNQVIATKIIPKRHEYALVFEKP